MLGVFLLPAFTHLGHECQDVLSLCECMCAQSRPWSVLSFEFGGNGVKTHLTPREKSLLPEKFSQEEDRTQDAASSRTASPTHYEPAIPAPPLAQLTRLLCRHLQSRVNHCKHFSFFTQLLNNMTMTAHGATQCLLF